MSVLLHPRQIIHQPSNNQINLLTYSNMNMVMDVKTTIYYNLSQKLVGQGLNPCRSTWLQHSKRTRVSKPIKETKSERRREDRSKRLIRPNPHVIRPRRSFEPHKIARKPTQHGSIGDSNESFTTMSWPLPRFNHC